MKSLRATWILWSAALLVCCQSQAITITLDYTYDTNNFFGANPGAVTGLNAAAPTACDGAVGTGRATLIRSFRRNRFARTLLDRSRR